MVVANRVRTAYPGKEPRFLQQAACFLLPAEAVAGVEFEHGLLDGVQLAVDAVTGGVNGGKAAFADFGDGGEIAAEFLRSEKGRVPRCPE